MITCSNRIFENSGAVPDCSKFIAVRSYRRTIFTQSFLCRLTRALIKYHVAKSVCDPCSGQKGYENNDWDTGLQL